MCRFLGQRLVFQSLGIGRGSGSEELAHDGPVFLPGFIRLPCRIQFGGVLQPGPGKLLLFLQGTLAGLLRFRIAPNTVGSVELHHDALCFTGGAGLRKLFEDLL